jgi:hypothetical protein
MGVRVGSLMQRLTTRTSKSIEQNQSSSPEQKEKKTKAAYHADRLIFRLCRSV